MIAAGLFSSGIADSDQQGIPNRHGHPCLGGMKQFRAFAGDVWALRLWRRGSPSPRVFRAEHIKLGRSRGCGYRGMLKAMWHRLRIAYNDHRADMLWLEKFKPEVYPDGTRWAVPYPIAWCESGGNYYVGPSGAYGLIPPFPQYLPPKVQDEVARRLYLEQGEAPWAPYESECAYR